MKNRHLNMLVEIYIDPQSASQRLNTPTAWLVPLTVVGITGIVLGFANLPTLTNVLERSLPAGLSPEQVDQTLTNFILYQKIGYVLLPLITLIKWSFLSSLLFMSCVLLDIKVTFKQLFALIAQCAVLMLLQDLVAHLIVSLRRAEAETVADLVPKLGLDLFLSGFSHTLGKTLMTVIGYFSIFNIWYIVVLFLSISYLGRCSKPKAFIACIPVWFLPLCLAVGLSWLS
ncbi:MAG: YIP1 family protein [Acidobacteria bacterium]|nr:YIP1 family protein [Acidobacteriota bacterium]